MSHAQPQLERTSGGLVVVRLFNLPVNYDLSWKEAVSAGFPQTTDDQRIVRCENLYPNDKTGTEIVPCISLFECQEGWNTARILNLVKETKLSPISPRMAFAVGQTYPTLNTDIGREYITIESLQTCKFEDIVRVPSPWYNNEWREGRLTPLEANDRGNGSTGGILIGLIGDILLCRL